MSELKERHAIALRLTEFAPAEVFGGDVTREEHGKYYGFGMSLRRTMDGEVRVYSSAYIMVRSVGGGGDGDHVFGSEQDAAAYLKARFKDFDMQAAAKVPRKPARKARTP